MRFGRRFRRCSCKQTFKNLQKTYSDDPQRVASLDFGLVFKWKLERAKGFEPSTPTLARLCSTPELRPLGRKGGDSSPPERARYQRP
jgi:hypothetical protein